MKTRSSRTHAFVVRCVASATLNLIGLALAAPLNVVTDDTARSSLEAAHKNGLSESRSISS
ncbi:MAG: hypothetical protein H7Y61_04595 [Rhizobiales bacterium]|nr:hypothetical protein [Rhizobacter sp.]